MNIALWIIAAVLALVFLTAGSMKLTQPKAKLAAAGQGWVENVPTGAIKAIGNLLASGVLGLLAATVAITRFGPYNF